MDNLIVAADILKNKLAVHARGITPMAVKRKLDQDEDFILLDVRSPAEHAEVSIEGAKLIPLGILREKLDSLPKDKEIVVVCRTGHRSAQGRDILRQAGFTNVTSMAGGVTEWQNQGLAIATGP